MRGAKCFHVDEGTCRRTVARGDVPTVQTINSNMKRVTKVSLVSPPILSFQKSLHVVLEVPGHLEVLGREWSAVCGLKVV